CLLGKIFSTKILFCILFKRNSRVTSLLRAIMDQPILADIQIPAASAAPPIVAPGFRQIFLKSIVSGIALLPKVFHLEVYFALQSFKRFERAEAVVDDPKRTGKP